MTVYYGSNNQSGWCAGKRFPIDKPSVSIQALGMHGDAAHHWRLVDDGRPDVAASVKSDKPPYRVPSMAEIAAVPCNGFKVASLFAGCGGSSLGYRMAGFRVVWANEFVPIAAECYRANMTSETVLDQRDVRAVTAADVLAALGMTVGELDVLDGSPPCQAFSTAGQREKGWGVERVYEHGARQKNEELFTEYIRLLRGLRPKVFVAENVSGLARGVAKGFFVEIFRDLKASGYHVAARLLDAQWLGVPQMRHRVIFIGTRDDLDIEPMFPAPLAWQYSIRDACPWIAKARSGPTGFQARFSAHAPAPAVVASMQAPYGAHEVESEGCKRKFTIDELKRLCSFPDDFVMTGSYAQQWERLGNSVPPLMMRAIAEKIRTMLTAREKRAHERPQTDSDADQAVARQSGKAKTVRRRDAARAGAWRS